MDEHIYKGNLLNSSAKVIGHQVNCLGVMGAGVAKAIRDKWPEVYEAYAAYCLLHLHGKTLLGHAFPAATKDGHIVMNLFGQYRVRRQAGQLVTNYDALDKAMQSTAYFMRSHDLGTIALPYGIGCGLGGGDWNVVWDIICRAFNDTGISVELWKLE